MEEIRNHIMRLELEGNAERIKGVKDALHFMGKYIVRDNDGNMLILDYKSSRI